MAYKPAHYTAYNNNDAEDALAATTPSRPFFAPASDSSRALEGVGAWLRNRLEVAYQQDGRVAPQLLLMARHEASGELKVYPVTDGLLQSTLHQLEEAPVLETLAELRATRGEFRAFLGAKDAALSALAFFQEEREAPSFDSQASLRSPVVAVFLSWVDKPAEVLHIGLSLEMKRPQITIS